MPSAVYTRFPLQPHPATPCTAVDSLWVTVAGTPGRLTLRCELAGDLARLRIPPPAASPQATDGLWRHTCFEAFVGVPQTTAYREFNFAPSGHWAIYDFEAERVRAADAPLSAAPQIAFDREANTLTLTATLDPALVPDSSSPQAALLGLSAVIETADGQLSYWALAHPKPAPDFHARAGWSARLPVL